MALHQIIDLTCEDRNTIKIKIEEPEIEIIYENLSEVQVINDSLQRIEINPRIKSNVKRKSLWGRNKYKKLNSFNYKEYLMEEYSNIHKFNKYYRNSACKDNEKNINYKLESKMFSLSYQNKGYRMLSKLGWKPDEGLGINGEGIKYPVMVKQ